MKTITKLITFFLILFTIAGCLVPATNELDPSEMDTRSFETQAVSLATPTPTIEPNDRKLSIDNVNQWEVINKIGMGEMFDYALSPNTPELAYATSNGVFIHNFETGLSEEFLIQDEESYYFIKSWPPTAVAYSPDGKHLAIGIDEIRIYNIEDKKCIERIQNSNTDFSIYQIDYAPDGEHIVVQGRGPYAPCDTRGAQLSLFEVAGEPYPLFHQMFCYEVPYVFHTFLDDGNVIFVGRASQENNFENTAFKIDIETGELIEKIELKNGLLGSVSHDGKVAAFRHWDSPEGVFTSLIDFDSGKILSEREDELFYINQSDFVLSDNKDSLKVSVLNRDLEKVCEFDEKPYLLFSINRNKVKFTSGKLISPSSSLGDISVYDLSTCQKIWELPVDKAGFIRGTISPDGKVFLGLEDGRIVRAYDLETGEYLHHNYFWRPPGWGGSSTDEQISIPVDSDSSKYMVKSDENTLVVYDLRTGVELDRFQPDPAKEIVSFDSHDFKTLYVEYDQELMLYTYDVSTREQLDTIRLINHDFFQLSDDGKQLLLVDHTKIVSCDLPMRSVSECHLFPVIGDYLWSQSIPYSIWEYLNDKSPLYGALTLKNLHTNKTVRLENFSDLLPKYKYHINSATVSPDESLILALFTQLNKNELRVWDARTGEGLLRSELPKTKTAYRDHYFINAVRLWFTPDGEQVLVYINGIIHVIGLPEK